jgi:hypothetical protein
MVMMSSVTTTTVVTIWRSRLISSRPGGAGRSLVGMSACGGGWLCVILSRRQQRLWSTRLYRASSAADVLKPCR